MGATQSQIDSIKEYATELQRSGVLGDEVLLSGGQQLASFLNNTNSLKTLMSAMADLTAQQKGLNATTSDATTIANQLGKAMATNNLSALKRSGITVSDEEVARFQSLTNEEEKAAYLAQIIKNNVGSMNQALANTPSGKIQQLKNDWGDLKETIGNIATSVLAQIATYLDFIIQKLNVALTAFAKFVNSIFKINFKGPTGGLSDETQEFSDTVSDGVDSIGGAAASAAKKINRATLPFDELNKIADTSSSNSGGGGGISTNSNSINNETKEEEGLLDKLNKQLEELKNAWNTGWNNAFLADTEKLKTNVGRIKSALKDIISDKDVQESASNFILKYTEMLGALAGSFVSIGTDIGIWITGGIARALEEKGEDIKNWISKMYDEAALYCQRIEDFVVALADIFTVLETDEAENALAKVLEIAGDILSTVSLIYLELSSDMLNMITQPIVDNVEKIKEALKNTFGFIAGILTNVETIISGFCTNVVNLYEQHIRPVVQKITDLISNVFGILLDGYNEYVAPVMDELNAIFAETIENYIMPFLDDLFMQLGTLFDLIGVAIDFISPIIEYCAGYVMPVIGGLIEAIGKVAIKITNGLFIALRFIINPIGMVENATEKLKSKFEGLPQVFSNVSNGIKNTFSGIKETVKSAINGCIDVINGMINSLNRLHITIPSVNGGAGKTIGFNIPQIPRLANGGYVNKNNPQLAVIGDNRKYGEVVANDKQLADLGNSIISGVVSAIGNTNTNQPIYLSVSFGDEDVTDLMKISASNYKKRTGKQLFI